MGVIIQRYLPWIELATVLAIALIVGLYFRSVGAPLATLLCSGVAAPRASRAITTAGLALAAGFAVPALVPLDQFRELAVAMVLGIVIDTFVVRSLLVPALVLLFGRAVAGRPG